MVSDFLAYGAIILVSLTSVFILVSHDWRYGVVVLAIQYIGVFLLVSVSWPLEMALVKVLAGWMAGAILGSAMASGSNKWREPENSGKSSLIFSILAAAILGLAIASLVLHSEAWLSSIRLPVRWGSFVLIAMGLLQLSFTSHPLRVITGLLTALSGFEIIYAAIESSTLVTGLLAGVNLGLALVGAYILIAPSMEGSR